MAKIFISHSSTDKEEIATPLFNHLKTNHTVWYDSERIAPGDSIASKIAEGMDQSDCFVLLISDDYNQRAFCQREQDAIIYRHINKRKRLLIVKINNARISSIIEDLSCIEYTSDSINIQSICDAIDRSCKTTVTRVDEPDFYIDKLVSDILQFRSGCMELETYTYITSGTIKPKDSILNEGVILIKPGGTFYKPCLEEIFKRIVKKCIINKVIVFDGRAIKRMELFDKQYNTPVRIATGDIKLSVNDYEEINRIYNTAIFKREYGVAYSNSLVVPALKLCEEKNIGLDELTRLWDEGRQPNKFWNGRHDGLNKIGYQKSVYPIKIRYENQPDVRIVVNGYIPGLKKLFTDDKSRVIALHISTNEKWNDLRLNLIGHKSNPDLCKEGTIRKDATIGRIQLDPKIQGNAVNGQKNICHMSGCLFDGMRELTVWFDMDTTDTVLGRILKSKGISTERIKLAMDNSLPDISWSSTKSNNGEIDDVIFHVIDEADDLNNFIVENEIRSDLFRQVSDKIIQSYFRDAKLKINIKENTDLLKKYNIIKNRLKTFISEGLYYKILKNERYFARRVAKVFENDDNEERLTSLFYEVVNEIEKIIQKDGNTNVSPEIVAEAYKIAANDIKFISNNIYKTNVDSPMLFYSKIVTELPEQAINCARRIRYNFVKELSSINPNICNDNPTCISDRKEWKTFVQNDLQHIVDQFQNTISESPITTLILCGGRSTRMNSTIPKHILPLGEKFLFDWVSDMILEATKKSSMIYAATGFRSELSDLVYGNRIRNIKNELAFGPAFRVATCLEALKDNTGLFIVVYTDMPYISPTNIRKLIEHLKSENSNKKTFGMMTSFADLGGYVIRDADNNIESIIQARIEPMNINDEMGRDVGLYIFYNTQEFRDALLSVSNSNVRGEYYFADVVNELYKKGWNIVDVEETKANSRCVNTSSDLLRLVSDIDFNVNFDDMCGNFKRNYHMSISEHIRRNNLKKAIEEYNGPFYFFKFPE
ncbi:MAG: TIR domain-containing protein [Nitrospirae bacterium]|uniref:TIR domain-containing protein n=1 Tax=Candidatus Magnetobacterium casense TaxID=1455061 RepID=UPI000590374B|nr:TIR domain-containing protein [Candidatus Magnetobacterium casensis]MBF0336456.1 TIR domain-containing protein [Nitrospirota bacterium]